MQCHTAHFLYVGKHCIFKKILLYEVCRAYITATATMKTTGVCRLTAFCTVMLSHLRATAIAIKKTRKRRRSAFAVTLATAHGLIDLTALVPKLLRDLELCDFFSVSHTALMIFYWAAAQLSCWKYGSLMKVSQSALTETIFECRYSYRYVQIFVVTCELTITLFCIITERFKTSL